MAVADEHAGLAREDRDYERYYPTQVLSTAKDIIFFWVARMNFAGLHFDGRLPYRDVYLHSTITEHLWKANSPNRDFRQAKWESTALEGTDECSCEVEAPTEGWVASFVSVTLPPVRDGAPSPTISTPIRILPESFPHKLPPTGAIGE